MTGVERSRLRWFRHLVRTPPDRLPREMFQTHPAGKRPQGQTQVQVEKFDLCTGLGTPWDPQSDLADVAREMGGWCPLLKLLPLQHDPG